MNREEGKRKQMLFQLFLKVLWMIFMLINTKRQTLTKKSHQRWPCCKRVQLAQGLSTCNNFVTGCIRLQSFQLSDNFFGPCLQNLLIFKHIHNSSELTNFSNIPIILPAHFEYFQEMTGNKRSFNIWVFFCWGG